MAIGNTSDWKKIDVPGAKERVPDWRRFEKPSTADRVRSQEREQESRRRSAYEEYVRFENSQPQVRGKSPLSYEQWSRHLPVDVTDISLASQIATNAALLSRVRSEEAAQAEAAHVEAKNAVLAGKPDPNWKIPASAVGLKMTLEKGRAFAREQGDLFVAHNPDYYPCSNNLNNIREYLIAQGISIPTEEAFKLAWLRLRELGLIEERPAPEPEPTPIQEPPSEQPTTEPEIDQLGWDLETGEKRLYKPYEVFRMSAEQYRQAFRVSPKFTRGYFG